MSRGAAVVMIVVAGLMCLRVPCANAEPLRLDEPSAANYLIGEPGASEFTLIDEALAKPAFAKLLSVFSARGYMRDVVHDRATSLQDGALVMLAYTVPGHPEVGAVAYFVSSRVEGVVQTRVFGLLLEIDPVSGELAASSLMTQGHPPVSIGIADMSKSGPSNYISKEDAAVAAIAWLGCMAAMVPSCTQVCANYMVFGPQAVATCEGVCLAASLAGCSMFVWSRIP